MTVLNLTADAFPSFRRAVRAKWAPITVEPISGSLERLVVGVAVVSQDGFHLEGPNALNRLRCFYSDDADAIVRAVRIALEALRHDLERRMLDAIISPNIVVSGISVGDCLEAEGESLSEIGSRWMGMLSSLYDSRIQEILDAVVETPLKAQEAPLAGLRDQLPALVLDYVKVRRDGFAKFFSRDLQDGRKRRNAGRSHEVLIDFSGSRLVANFGTLQVQRIAPSINLIKRRLWDLKVQRDAEPKSLVRAHELILQVPRSDDPQVSWKQHAKVKEAMEALEAQADQEQLRLRPLNTVPDIGEHVLRAEAA